MDVNKVEQTRKEQVDNLIPARCLTTEFNYLFWLMCFIVAALIK